MDQTVGIAEEPVEEEKPKRVKLSRKERKRLAAIEFKRLEEEVV